MRPPISRLLPDVIHPCASQANAVAYPVGKRPTKWQRRHFAGETVLTLGADGLNVELQIHRVSEVPSPPIRVVASGTWTTPVAVDGKLLAGLAGKFGRARSITLNYVDGRLVIDELSVPARELVAMA